MSETEHNETQFIDMEIKVDEKIEDIFRIIEGKVLKEDFSNMMEGPEEIKILSQCITKARDIKQIYEQEQRAFIVHQQNLQRQGVTNEAFKKTYDDIELMIKRIDEYIRSLEHFIEWIAQSKNSFEQLKPQAREHTAQIHEAYNRFIKDNEDTLNKLKIVRGMVSQ
jgi:hypothetical protein